MSLQAFAAIETYSRRLLLNAPLHKQPATLAASAPGGSDGSHSGELVSNFDANVVMILAVLLCALICALGLNSIVRCALRCSNRMAIESEPEHVARLAQTGLRRKVIRSLPILVYSDGVKLPGASSECAICLSDFAPGERVRVLPKCNHGFHVKCIDRWLMARSSCPTCRQCLFHTRQKVIGCAESNHQQPPPELVIVPLEREGSTASYR